MKTDRLVSIIMTLLNKKRVSAKELAEQFEVSHRTIYRDIDAINAAGIPVCAVSGKGGGFEIMENYKIEKNVFSESDICTILTGLLSIPDAIRGDEFLNALAKIKSLVPADKADDISVRTHHIRIDTSAWLEDRTAQPYMELIKNALLENRLISFSYTAHYGNRMVRTVEPYQLVLKNGCWYVYGFCRVRDDFRLFKFSRIENLHTESELFVPRDFQNPILNCAARARPMQTTITLRVHRAILDRVLDFCPHDRISPDGAEHFIVDFPFIENDWNYDALLGFGSKCECLAPPRTETENARAGCGVRRRVKNLMLFWEFCLFLRLYYTSGKFYDSATRTVFVQMRYKSFFVFADFNHLLTLRNFAHIRNAIIAITLVFIGEQFDNAFFSFVLL